MTGPGYDVSSQIAQKEGQNTYEAFWSIAAKLHDAVDVQI